MEQSSSSTALSTLSPDLKLKLAQDRERQGGGQFPVIPQIRLANKDMTQAPEGEYFIETKKGKDEDPEITPIGKNPEIVVLYKTNTYSYFTKEDGLIAWTSDIHGFSALDHVTLYCKKYDPATNETKVVIDFDGVWPDYRKHMEAKYTTQDPVTGKKTKLLKFKTVLYVLYEGKPHKMFVSNASSAGVDDKGNPSFDKPQPRSLQAFTDECWFDKRTTYEFGCTLGSAFVQSSKPFYIMQFGPFRELPENELAVAIQASHAAQNAIDAIDEARKRSVIAEYDRPVNITPEEAQAVFADDITPTLD